MTISTLSEKQRDELIEKGLWKKGCPVSLDRLRVVTVSYIDFDGKIHDHGEIIVFDAIASSVEQVFSKLLKAKFPISKVKSMSCYDGDDELSMRDNNSSSFNHRVISNSQFLSLHSYGMAIDINPLQNPYLQIDQGAGQVKVSPPNGWEYLNRRNYKPGMVEELVPIFEEQGFIVWGGRWTIPIDYHHFQIPRGLAEVLSAVSYDDGQRIFRDVYKYKELVIALASGEKLRPLLAEYEADKIMFVENFYEIIKRYLD